jgi:hypothetical protein
MAIFVEAPMWTAIYCHGVGEKLCGIDACSQN